MKKIKKFNPHPTLAYLLGISLFIIPLINPLGNNQFTLIKTYFLSGFIGLLMIGSAIYLLLNKKFSIIWNKKLFILIALWTLSLTLSTLFSQAPELSFWGSYSRLQGLYIHLIYIALFFFTIHFLSSKENRNNFLKLLILLGSLIAFYALAQRFYLLQIANESGESIITRPVATIGQPNFLGQFLIYPIWTTVYFFKKVKQKNSKSLYIALLIIQTLALISTENRATMLALTMAVGFYLFYSSTLKKQTKIILSISAILILTIILSTIFPSTRSLITRLIIWQSSLDLIASQPLIGHGLETFENIFQGVLNPKIYSVESVSLVADRAHNDLLEIYFTQGLFGLSIFFSTVFLIFKNFFRKKAKNKEFALICLCIFITYLVSNFFSFSITIHYYFLFIFLALYSLNQLQFQKSRLKNPILKLVAALTLFLAGSFYFTTSGSAIKSDMLYAKANFFNEEDQAIFALETFPHFEDLYYQEALNNKGSQEGESLIEKYGKITGQNYRYHFAKAIHLKEKQDYPNAQFFFQSAVDLAPNNLFFLRELAINSQTINDEKNFQEAKEKIEWIIINHWQPIKELNQQKIPAAKKLKLFTDRYPEFKSFFKN